MGVRGVTKWGSKFIPCPLLRGSDEIVAWFIPCPLLRGSIGSKHLLNKEAGRINRKLLFLNLIRHSSISFRQEGVAMVGGD
jgi:hypothetical protein